jgi:hypothetical protein
MLKSPFEKGGNKNGFSLIKEFLQVHSRFLACEVR